MLLDEAIHKAELIDDVINTKVIKSGKIYSVDMKSFETTVKYPVCNAVIADASVDDDIKTCEIY